MPLAFILVGLVVVLYFAPLRFKINAYAGDKGSRFALEMLVLYGLLRFKHYFASDDDSEAPPQEVASDKGRKRSNRPKRAFKPPTLGELWRKVSEYGLGVAMLSLFVRDSYMAWVSSFSASRTSTRCLRLQWITRLGLDDAAATAVATGLAYAVIGTGLGLVQKYVDFSRCRVTQISVIPSFSEAGLETSLSCILDLKVGHIIAAGCQNYLLHLFRRKE